MIRVREFFFWIRAWVFYVHSWENYKQILYAKFSSHSIYKAIGDMFDICLPFNNDTTSLIYSRYF